jgi:hypothetical protein
MVFISSDIEEDANMASSDCILEFGTIFETCSLLFDVSNIYIYIPVNLDIGGKVRRKETTGKTRTR